MARLRLIKHTPPSELAYTNRRGTTFYLHEGRTKTGKPRYFFAKTVREGALAELPQGYEVGESINGVVSVRRRRSGPPQVPDADVEVVRAAVSEQPRLQDYEVRADGKAIVIYEPSPSRAELRQLEPYAGPFSKDWKRFASYAPVLKLVREEGGYAVHRMTYRGEGGWSWPLGSGDLRRLAKKFVRYIGTDEFFNLM